MAVEKGSTGNGAINIPDAHLLPIVRDAPAPPSVGFTRTVRRREDFLMLKFEFRNLRLDNAQPRRLVKILADVPAYVVVLFQPQHVADEALLAGAPPPPGNVRTRVAGPSRLAFQVRNDRLPLRFDLSSLLDWDALDLRVVPAAEPPVPGGIRDPAPHETAIEIPWFLVLSPPSSAGWDHARLPVTHTTRTELWHTRLGRQSGGIAASNPPVGPLHVRAVWARDLQLPAHDDDLPFPMSLNRGQRIDLVELTSVGSGRKPVEVNRLILSALGGWLDAQGSWDPPPLVNVVSWRHRATMGRDSYVRVVERGYLAPFGHRAVKVTVSERKFSSVGGGFRGAYLQRTEYVVIRQPLKLYGTDNATGQDKDGRSFPFRAVRITTLATPPLQPEGGIFFPKDAKTKKEILFDVVAVDWSGQPVEFSAPMMFMTHADAFDRNAVELRNMYNTAPVVLRRRPLHGQRVAFAPHRKLGDTSFETVHLELEVERPKLATPRGVLAAAEQPPFFPTMGSAEIRLAAAEQTSGQLLGNTKVRLDDGFIDHVWDSVKNAGEVFLELVDDAPALAFGNTEKAGGIATPNLSITGLSRKLGPVGGALAQLREGTFDPDNFFDGAAKLLGSLKLADVIGGDSGPDGAPRIKTELRPEPPAIPTKVITSLEWEPELRADPLNIFNPTDGSSLALTAALTTDLQSPGNSTFEVEGTLRDFVLNLIGDNLFMRMEVKELRFTAGKDKKPNLEVEIGEITFAGVLQFVEEFRNFLSSLGKGLSIDVSPKGIDASLTIPLPSIGVGVFSIQNISIVLGTTIPFNGDAIRFRFGFCSRENPFTLTVAIFGGGGFFGLECGSDKSVMLEISLEFGAGVAFDIGVASGGVEVFAGIYIMISTGTGTAELTGFLRAGGTLSVLGIISITCELYLGFTYEFATDKCVGRARFYLEIEILIFSITVSAEVERRFGGENDPTFDQMMPPDAWTEYCGAYAQIGAP